MTGAAPRAAAARVLEAVLSDGRSLRTAFAAELPALADPRDRALVEAICFAAIRQHVRADAAIAAWMPRPPGRRDAILRALLHAGFAQLDPLGLSPHAAVAETVEAARALGRAHQAGLVNAVLRRAQREGLPPGEPAAQWPTWLRDRVAHDWPGHVEAVLAASAAPAPLWLRVNLRRGTRDAYRARLADAGIDAVAVDGLDAALRLDAPVPVHQLPGFAEGDVSVQDAAAQSVAAVLAPAAGARVLDACAAPGGKAAHLLERDATLHLLAADIDPARLRRVGETFDRLGIAGATLRAVDVSTPDAWWDGVPFDAVLLDAPCSATGIVRRQPDVLLHRRPADLEALEALQGRLLDAAWRVLAPGGVLVYATCSILRAENAAQVDAFLARTPDATADRDAGPGNWHPDGAGRQRLTGEAGMDGFFLARLRKAARPRHGTVFIPA